MKIGSLYVVKKNAEVILLSQSLLLLRSVKRYVETLLAFTSAALPNSHKLFPFQKLLSEVSPKPDFSFYLTLFTF